MKSENTMIIMLVVTTLFISAFFFVPKDRTKPLQSSTTIEQCEPCISKDCKNNNLTISLYSNNLSQSDQYISFELVGYNVETFELVLNAKRGVDGAKWKESLLLIEIIEKFLDDDGKLKEDYWNLDWIAKGMVMRI